MSLPYALEIQKSYANNFSRIGLPVHPPTTSWPSVEICCEGADGNWKVESTVERGAQLIRRRRNEEIETLFVLSREVVFRIPQALKNADEFLNSSEKQQSDRIATAVDESKDYKDKIVERATAALKRLSERRIEIHNIDCSPEACLPMVLTPRVLNVKDQPIELGAGLPSLFVNCDLKGKYAVETPLALNIKIED